MYCVSHFNLWHTSALDSTVCPKVLFTGLKPNYRKELSLAFGDYVEVHTGTDNTARERSVPCIALYPVGNATGTWQFWNLCTKRYMRHSTWVHMRHSELISDIINNIAETEQEAITNNEQAREDVIDDFLLQVKEEKVPDEPETEPGRETEEETRNEESETIVTPIEETGGQGVRRSARIASGIKPPDRFIHARFMEKGRWKEEAAVEAIKAEVKQLFRDLSALQPIQAETIIAGACVLTCHIFLVEKFLANGNFDNMKARLVSHGNKQNKEDFLDRSSLLSQYIQ
jgi:hypothetical protein